MSNVMGSLDRDLSLKQQAKYDPAREAEARNWIEQVTGEKLSSSDFHESLKNGQLLCKLAMKVSKTTVKFNTSAMPFKQMENINLFLGVLNQLNVPKSDQFQTVDLFEAKNMGQVVDTIFALSRNATKNGYSGPQLGPKLAQSNERVFTQEQLNEGKNIQSMQTKGSHGGANASGMSYGSRRQIDSKTDAGSSEPSMQTQGSISGANAAGISYGGKRDIGGQDPGRS